MEDLNYWLIYIVTVFIASIIPGPSMLLALVHGLKYGAKASMSTALGNTTASLIQATVAVAGLSVILTTSTTLFMVIKYVGAAYLIYLGIKLFKTPFTIDDSSKNNLENKPNLKKMFTEAFIVAAANPKALLFFTALFPQFINESQNNIFHYSMLVLILGAIAFICMMIYSLSSYLIKDLFNKTSLPKYFSKIVGSTFIGLGASLALSKNKLV